MLTRADHHERNAADFPLFDGVTFIEARDGARLTGQLERVAAFLADGQWHTLAEIAAKCQGSEAGCSARIRDLRKARHGGHIVEKVNCGGGLWKYRMVK